MSVFERWRIHTASLAAALLLAACGGGGGSDAPAQLATPDTPTSVAPQEPGAPTLTNNIAMDGMNWVNYRRAQAGLPVLTRNELIDRAAQGHSDYQKTNNTITHDQTAGKPGFTGERLGDRLTAAGYIFANTTYAHGEVISATSNNSGFYMVDELIAAIYHRFVIFEPRFREIGTGAATTNAGYTYFTSDFATRNGYGPGIGRGNLVTWPANDATGVATNFFSDYEAPDPVAGVNEVGYPVSVHADIDAVITVQSFTIRPRGGADLAVKMLRSGEDPNTTTRSAAAIVPLAVLRARTTYDVTFTGTVSQAAVSRTWSFTTR
ncbi:CAP domain-containing protein [Massilia cavernae]|uniref:CAP domain-containing protein n=1 Tax=Massilia cavernae TaxID=2320864 RepID=A0A418XGU8_9BURK|nr:CAP domain-containing protein [Massilia cavernae]RJG11692.1 CAP domain-containing protein [Massilia cavernae]